MPYRWPAPAGVLQLGGVAIDRIAAQFDTPCYVTDAGVIAERHRQLVQALDSERPATIAYACKANTNLAILHLLHRQGCAVDAVSPGEVAAALRVGAKPEQIMFTGTNPRDDELRWLAERNVWINIDSLSMARRLLPHCSARSFSIRINPGVGAGHHEHVVTGTEETKFGLREEELPELLALCAAHGHRVARLHAHIGSGIMEANPFLTLIDELGRIAKGCAGHPAVALEAVDIGGGFGVPYHPDDTALDLPALATAIGKRFRQWFGPTTTLMVEPGRYFVAESTLLLTRVNTIKATPQTTFLGVDAGFHTLLRPMLYNAYHHIIAPTKMGEPMTYRYTICGPICETGDILGHHCPLPEIREGDLLAICDTGAYGFAMASTYNSRPRPAEIMVIEGKAHLTRRRETIDDLFQFQGQTPDRP